MQNDTSIAWRLPRAEEEKEFLLTENERTSATPANGVKSESQNGPPLPSAQIPYVEVTDWTEFMTWDTDGLFFGDDVYSPVESFPVDTLQDRDVLLDNGYSLSGTPPSCTDSAYYSLLGDVSTPMTPSLISSQLATAFTASEGAKLKTATADTLDKQDEELHVKSSSFTTQGEETSGLTPVSRTQIPGSITCTTTESSPTTEQSVCSEGSSSSSEGGEAQDLESTRQQVLDRLMVQFYDIYAHHVQCTHRGTTGEGLSIIQSRTSARSECDRIDEKGKRTRKHDEDDGDGDGDDDVSKRRKLENQASQESQHTIKRLACPYHQHDPQKQQASRACSGPG